MLIDKVPDLNVANAKGQTPLHLAAFCRVQSDGLELMVDANSALNEKAQDGRTPLHLACTKGPPVEYSTSSTITLRLTLLTTKVTSLYI